jgi:hypothetical protein
VSCTPSAMYTNGTSACDATVSGTGSYRQGVTWSTNVGTISQGGDYTAPSAAGTATVKACADQSGYTNMCGVAALTVSTPPPPPPVACTPGVNCPVCGQPLTANPSSIVVPELSNLNYSCSNVTECQLTGGDLNVLANTITLPSLGTITGSATDTPSSTTTYTLTCVNSNANSTSSTATVTVNGSSLCEQNPNGAGCQGQ